MTDTGRLNEVLDEIEEVVVAARAMPMSTSALVGREQLLSLVEQARAALPDQIAHADQVLADADRVLADAHSRAQEIVEAARQRAERLVSTDQIVREAQVRAAEIVADATGQAEDMRRDADDYCDRRLADFEIDLGRIVGQVQAGRAKLAGRLGPSSG